MSKLSRSAMAALLAASVLALTACGGQSGSAQEAETAAPEATAEAATETEETEETADAAETAEAAEAAEAAETTETAAAGHLADVLSSGKLIVAMEGNWAPWSFHDMDTDEVIGFDADVARGIAEELGVEIEIVEAPWESLLAGLDAGRYDLVINGIEITEERSEKYDFSIPYGYIKTALIVREDNEEIKSFEDLKGKSTVNSIASTYMTLAESYGATATGVSTLNDTLQNVLDGRADATLNADVSFYDYMNQHPDAPLKIAATTEESSHVAIPIRKGDEEADFIAAVDAAIEAMRADGRLSAISETYFGSDITNE